MSAYLAILEPDDDGDRHLHLIHREWGARQEPVNRRRVGESHEEFFHHLILPNRTRHIRHLHVRRKELADKMIPIEGAYALAAHASGHLEQTLMRHVPAAQHIDLVAEPTSSGNPVLWHQKVKSGGPDRDVRTTGRCQRFQQT